MTRSPTHHSCRWTWCGAVARAIEHSARLADDSAKLSMQIGYLADVLREADYWAGEAGRAVIGGFPQAAGGELPT